MGVLEAPSLDGPICANRFADSREYRLIEFRANRFRVPELNPFFFANRVSGHYKIASRRFEIEAIRANHSNILKIAGSPRFGSVWLRFGGGTVRAVPVFGSGGSSAKKVFRLFCVFQHSLTGKDGSGSGFGSWKTVPAVPVPLSVSGKTVPTVPVPGSGSVPEPP